MNILFYGLAVFIIALVIHLIVWRMHLPKKQIEALSLIFSSALFLGLFCIFKFPQFIKWNILPAKNLFEVIQFILLFVSVAVSYIVSYPAIQVDSPTLLIINAVSKAGAYGLDKNELEMIADNDLLLIPRIKDMLSDNMIYLEGEKYKLLQKGLIMARIFSFYRSIIREKKGG